MKIMLKILLPVAFFLLNLCSQAQANDRAIRQLVLERDIVDSTFIFGKWSPQTTKTELKYLGKVTANGNQTFKILDYYLEWGLAQRGTSRLLIFNNENQYAGEYGSFTGPEQLPTKLHSNKLVFENTGNDCDKRVTTVLNLSNGLPKQFFRHCQDDSGDLYYFWSDK